MLKANFSGGSFVTAQSPDRLVPGIYEFGRSILKFQDMRVSKTQVRLDVWPDHVSVTRKGKNLSCIVRSSGVVKLEIDEPVELKAGDTLYLLVSLYPIKFEAESLPFSTTPIAVALENAADDMTNTKKRSREVSPVIAVPSASGSMSKLHIEDSEDESDSDDGVVLLAKKPKLKEVENVAVAPVASGHWSGGLLQYLQDPVIKDKFPKAKLHLLVLPRQPLQNLSVLTKEHVSLLEAMDQLATSLASKWMANDASAESAKFGPPPGPLSHRVLIGFHAVPSMSQLHLHIISSDFDSPGLKTKKHWNSFNSPFFIAPSAVIQSLQVSQRVQFDKVAYEAYLDGPLKCHRCSQTLPNIPALKSHISSCSKT